MITLALAMQKWVENDRFAINNGGSTGGDGRQRHVPLSPISFIFMQFLGKVCPNNRLPLQPLGLAPSLVGNAGYATDNHYQSKYSIEL